MSTVVFTVKSEKSAADIADAFTAKDVREFALAASRFFREMASGHENAAVDVNYSATSPVYATTTISAVYADMVATDSVTIGGTAMACVTEGTPSATQFKKETDLATTVSNLAAAINANTTLNKFVTAVASATEVVVTCKYPGTIGNLITTTVSVGTPGALAVTGATMASGAGGATESKSSFSLGL